MTNLNTKKEISIAQAKEIKSECKFLNDEICYIEDIDVRPAIRENGSEMHHSYFMFGGYSTL